MNSRRCTARGIRVLTVSPGAIDTEMSNDYKDEAGDNVSQLIRAHSEDMIMLGRWGSPQEIANLIAFAASDDASYLTATTLFADGGWQRQHLPLSLRGDKRRESFHEHLEMGRLDPSRTRHRSHYTRRR